MVGICGFLGDQQHDIDSVAHTLTTGRDEETATYDDDTVQIETAVHRESNADQPASVPGVDVLLWIWGDVIGFEDGSGYTARGDDLKADATYCAELFRSHGLSFIDGLNSEFAGVVYDRSRGEITLFTDRLSARPVYFTEEIDGGMVFSTSINSILAHPNYQTSINDSFLSEFLKFERVFGIYTPFDGIYQLHPGSKLTYDLKTGEKSIETYWQPEYRPEEREYTSFVEEFAMVMEDCVQERRNESDDEGLFISGGSDSRLLVSLFEGGDVTGFHLNGSMNEEAKTARRVCDTAGVEFNFLQRDRTYLIDVLEKVSSQQIFSSFFDQAHFVGFEEEIKTEVDAVFTGHTADTVLEGFYMPTLEVSLPLLDWTVPLPLVSPIDNIESYRDYILESYQYNRGSSVDSQPTYLSYDQRPTEVLDKYMHETNDSIEHHGVSYPSLDSLSHAGGFYPITNNKAYLAYYSTNQMLPTHYPYLDNRVIDLSLSIPHRYHARRSIVNRAITNRNRALAEIPKSGVDLPLTYPRTIYSVMQLWRSLTSKFGSSSSSGGSWSNNATVLRETELAERFLLDQETADRSPTIVDWDTVEEMYRAHLNGENNYFDLYALLSLCNSYAAEQGLLTDR